MPHFAFATWAVSTLQPCRPRCSMHRSPPPFSSYSASAHFVRRRCSSLVAHAEPEADKKVEYNTEFGYSRKDIFLIGGGLIGLGYVMYYGLQAAGMDAGMAGNWVQLIIFLGICVGWVSTYVYRVATKVWLHQCIQQLASRMDLKCCTVCILYGKYTCPCFVCFILAAQILKTCSCKTAKVGDFAAQKFASAPGSLVWGALCVCCSK